MIKISETELDHTGLHPRDRWQFELKSDFFPHLSLKENICTQEFFLFVPDALLINQQTYTRESFYQDQTNLIRYKTPIFTFEELFDLKETSSPFYHMEKLKSSSLTNEHRVALENELKLLGNIVRSTLRNQVIFLINSIRNNQEYESDIIQLCQNVTSFKKFFQENRDYFHQWEDSSIDFHFDNVNEFISKSIHSYLIALKRRIPENISEKTQELLDETIIHEIEEREKEGKEPYIDKDHKLDNEYILYRRGLLNKFVLSVLLLNTDRFSPTSKYRHVVGALSAAIAMLIFLTLFIWQGEIVVINSAAFVALTVLLYVLKDRIKEGIRSISLKKAFQWFPDYTTRILSPDGKKVLGKIQESFSFVSEDILPEEIVSARNKEFHFVLESFKRPEQVLYHKKTVKISQKILDKKSATRPRRHGLNIIFRFNIHRFLKKASNPMHRYMTLDKKTKKLISLEMQKVYHLNVIMRNTYIQEDLSIKVELKKYRIVCDKTGIQRIEFLG